ncbi:sugar porter family MFS transporter [Rhodohalobacter barkolensis]|uniref:MFS transporter n=1 Tax=Rhodohalobacter barkolensis TaxID=2053187 RepID=A0A2N0VIM8_9BACT|nr:sugar porter family MFS transporter [Rhodohalobacter barkolensis]PKD44065.1 MFS transporter [Rhodohalobacter barkolensis]
MDNKNVTEEVGIDNMGRVIFLSTIAAIGGFLFGFDSGVINGTVGALQEAFNSDAVGTGFNVASMLLGCALGAFFGGSLADKFGRKPILLITAVAFIFSAWGSGAAGSSTFFVFARILGGFAVGAASVLVPAYISEIAPPKVRGALTTLMQLMIVIGLFIAFVSNYNIAGSAGGATEPFWGGFDAWQWMFWVEMIPAGIFFLGLLFIPESPRYLVAAGKLDEARAVLSSLATGDTADDKIKDIQSTLEENRKPRLSDIISKHTGKIQPIIWVGLGLTTLQQFTGINVVFYYGATLWQAAGFTEENALLQNVISGSVNVLFTFVAIALVDKVGRKPLLMIGALGQAVMLGILALIFGTAAATDGGALQLEGNMGLYALLSANGYIAFFAFTWGPIMWVMLGEMFPNQFRGAALAVCGLIHWLSNFTITMTFPVLLASIGLGLSYGIYAGFGVIAFFFVKRYVVETKGRTLEDMSRDIQK